MKFLFEGFFYVFLFLHSGNFFFFIKRRCIFSPYQSIIFTMTFSKIYLIRSLRNFWLILTRDKKKYGNYLVTYLFKSFVQNYFYFVCDGFLKFLEPRILLITNVTWRISFFISLTRSVFIKTTGCIGIKKK